MDEQAERERRGVGWLLLRGGALCLSLAIVVSLMVRSSAGCAGPEAATRDAEAPGSGAAPGSSGDEQGPATSPTQAPGASTSGKREYGSTGKSWADPNLIDRVLPAPSASQSSKPEEAPAFIPGTKSGVMIDRGRSQ